MCPGTFTLNCWAIFRENNIDTLWYQYYSPWRWPSRVETFRRLLRIGKDKGSPCNRPWRPKRGSRGIALPIREPWHEEGMGWLAPRPGRFYEWRLYIFWCISWCYYFVWYSARTWYMLDSLYFRMLYLCSMLWRQDERERQKDLSESEEDSGSGRRWWFVVRWRIMQPAAV
jgi:hypothetical protein